MEKSYTVTCKQCGASRNIRLFQSSQGEIIDWLDNNPDPQVVKIISGRKRLDGLWGWECVCGNNDILTSQEKTMLTNPASPDPKSVVEITKNTQVQAPMFAMKER